MKEDVSELIIGYLQGRLNKQEVSKFYTWVNEDAENKRLFFETKAVYDACIASVREEDMKESWMRLLRIKEGALMHKRFFRCQIGNYAAVALVTVALTSAYFTLFTKEDSGQVTRYIGGDGLEADVVELPDGTHVSLGSKTSFQYNANYGKKDRVIYLEGEAFFEVAKKKDKPFIVRTKGQDIEALGTKFNVTAYPHDSLLTTTLLQGSVLLTTAEIERKDILSPDEQLIYNRNTHSSVVQKVDAEQYISWTTGYYYFPEQSMQTILYRLSHVYGVQFTVATKKLNDRTFTGTFYRGQNIKDIMEIISLSVPIKYKINDHHVTITEIE